MIDKTFILALDKRRELWSELHYNCRQRGFDTECFIVGNGSDNSLIYNHIDVPGVPESWKWSSGISAQRHYWAFESHRQIIKRSLKAGYNNILMMEDDAYVIPSRFDKHWPEIEDFIMKEDPDLLYLGSHFGDYENHRFAGNNLVLEENYKQNQQISFLPIKQCGGLFACIINKRIFPMILNMPIVAPIDSQLNQYRSLIKSYNTLPMLCYVRSGFSYCENTYIERDKL